MGRPSKADSKKRTRITKNEIERSNLVAWGPEPVWQFHFDDSDLEREIGEAFNWYSVNSNIDDRKTWFLDYLKAHQYESGLISQLRTLEDYEFDTIGQLCRMVTRGCILSTKYQNKISERVDLLRKKLKERSKNSGNSSSTLTANYVVPKKPRIILDKKSENVILQIDSLLSKIYKPESKTINASFDIKDWILKNNLDGNQSRAVASYFLPIRMELNRYLIPKSIENDPDLVSQLQESYKFLGKKKALDIHNFLVKLHNACNSIQPVVAPRKPRKKKVKTPGQIVAKVKYQEKSAYGYISIMPKQILGSDMLITYHEGYRLLGIYYASGNDGLGIKGTSVINYDSTKSVCKILKKPIESLSQVMKLSKPDAKKFISTLNTTEKKMNGRLNQDTVLLKVF